MARKEFSRVQEWYYYANIFSGIPQNGAPEDAQCGIALAFGRNSVPDKDLASVRAMREKEGSDFAAIKKLAACGFDAGTPNKEIGHAVRMSILVQDLPMIVPWEIGVVLFKRYGDWVEHWIASKKLFILWPQPSQKSCPTKEVLEEAISIMRENGWHDPLLIGHDLHVPHVYMLARKLGLDPIVGFKSVTQAFDPNSVQPATSSRWRWLLTYEPWVRVHHTLHAWV